MSWNSEVYEREYNRFFRGFRLQYDYENPKKISKRANEVFYEAEAEQNFEKCKAMIDAYHDATTLPRTEEDENAPRIYDGVVHSHVLDDDGKEVPNQPRFTGEEHDADLLYDSILEILDDYIAKGLSRDAFLGDLLDILDDYDNAQ